LPARATGRGLMFSARRPDCVPLPRPPSMALTLDEVMRIAHLARIHIDADSARDVLTKLKAIFALINELRAIDTTGIEPMSHAQEVTAPLRDDVVTEGDRHADYQRVAPAVED